MTEEKCQESYDNNTKSNLKIHDGFLCAQAHWNVGPCVDAGGPLVDINGKSSKLVGVVVGDSSCGMYMREKSNFSKDLMCNLCIKRFNFTAFVLPKIFTNISFYHDWIQTAMKSNLGIFFCSYLWHYIYFE